MLELITNSPFINKTRLKSVMERTRLKNEFITYRCEGQRIQSYLQPKTSLKWQCQRQLASARFA